MKITIKTARAESKRVPFSREGDKSPCYYLNVEKNENRKDWKFIIGCKYFGLYADEEFSFKVAKFGDISSENVWQTLNSIEFGCDLLEKFKYGGEAAIKAIIKEHTS